ncbi:cation/calcium exchanger 2-like [Tripterygium wilfordii]|uniref:Cation/calcium exchanger 2-like n=1 Tax=Tripterygium wilfordii TaxID=458696 RepID=A0A7J7CM82_TRIWF|nr:cation/calcium exchanger 2-like [Tripterygium wilfordii]KAF5735182.1 cation/calcium exchanger 2-like [Tripterygium wilfordii]
MGFGVSVYEDKRCMIFLNVSFLLVACVFLIVQLSSSGSGFVVLSSSHPFNEGRQQQCSSIHGLDGYKAKCLRLKSNEPCVSQGYIDYLRIFYCNFGRFPPLGLSVFFLWLLVLFYLLGSTASEYFCSLLQNLSRLLKLSPTIAGITLLALGNGSPDVFASLASLMDSGTLDIGLNSVLGGTSFVTCAVVGIISFMVHKRRVQVNKCDLIRDVSFLLLVLASLIIILTLGRVNLLGALGFTSMYIVYVIVVCISHVPWINGGRVMELDANSSFSSDLSVPILSAMEKQDLNFVEETTLDGDNRLEARNCCFHTRTSASCRMLLYILEMPLDLPRRLTIPVVCEKKWSKPIAVTAVTLAPIFLSVLWNLKHENVAASCTSLVVYGIGFLFGITFGVLAHFYTEKSSPPEQCLFVWLVGGFLMSVVWSYITAQELVALLVSLGYIFGISPSILGLTILAWGNSLGDLVTNSTMAMNDGPEGVQVAIAGCYAGPIFNILFGLGMSLVSSSWHRYPSYILIPSETYLLETMGFLVVSLLWTLVVLPMRGMRLDGVLGGGLLAVYMISVSFRLIQSSTS